ncbi:O-antigen ligase family protein, partial [bacterium]|nr:O-antigen ligase family protein [bacterium]
MKERMFSYPLFVPLGLVAPFAIAIKLSLANLLLIPAILSFLWHHGRTFVGTCVSREKTYFFSLSIFIAVSFYSALFGLDIGNSLLYAIKMAFMMLLIPLCAAVSQAGYRQHILLSIVLGLCVSALHTIAEGAFPNDLFQYAHGAVSEAGQLTIGLFAAAALLSSAPKPKLPLRMRSLLQMSILPFLGFLLLGFSSRLQLSPPVQLLLAAVSLCYVILQGVRAFRGRSLFLFLTSLGLPLLAAALLLNLKRGPWIGVCTGFLLFFSVSRPRLLLPTILILFLAVLGIEPVRERAFSSLEHFLMVGGRGEIWSLGAELLVRYPLGIGLENSDIITEFSYDIPANLNHFHSNVINIAVELGWIGLVAYLWWLLSLVITGFQQGRRGETKLLACGVVSWQVAGLFEYNFGDSEVFLLALVLIGLLVGEFERSTLGSVGKGVRREVFQVFEDARSPLERARKRPIRPLS